MALTFRRSFLLRAGLTPALVAVADLLLDGPRLGAPAGVLGLVWLGTVMAIHPEVRRSRPALVAAGVATLLALSMIEDAGALAPLLFLPALGMVVLLPRQRRFDDAWHWFSRLVRFGFFSLLPFLDEGQTLLRLRARHGAPAPGSVAGRWLRLLAVPVLGALVFLFFFASANPLVERALAVLAPAHWLDLVDPARLAFWAVMAVLAWTSLRPRRISWRAAPAPPALPGLNTASLRLSLIVFNLIFAVENLLDLTFLWSGAALPDGVTMADYAHRGAYALIATALMAGGFVLAACRPGIAGDRLLFRLLLAWIGQNVLLVASSMRRTLDYVEAYGLTELRLAALVWMALVGLGLVLICLRLAGARSAAWLINANAAAAGVTLMIFITAIDPAAVVASWNVHRHLAAGEQGPALDWDYMESLGPAALLPVLELEVATGDEGVRGEARDLRAHLLANLERHQSTVDWWSYRGARRLAEARRRLASLPD